MRISAPSTITTHTHVATPWDYPRAARRNAFLAEIMLTPMARRRHDALAEQPRSVPALKGISRDRVRDGMNTVFRPTDSIHEGARMDLKRGWDRPEMVAWVTYRNTRGCPITEPAIMRR